MEMRFEPIDQDKACYNLLSAIINRAVEDYEEGNSNERASAARFFTGPRCEWICDLVNTTPYKIVENRLSSDPFTETSFKARKKKKKLSRGAKTYKWKGESMTGYEWAPKLGITVDTFVYRVGAWGLCERTFSKSHNAPAYGIIEWDGKKLDPNGWAEYIGIGYTAFIGRLKKFGICELTFTKGRISPFSTRKIKNNFTGIPANRYTWDGKSLTIGEWAKELGVSYSCIYARYRKYGLCAEMFSVNKTGKSNE